VIVLLEIVPLEPTILEIPDGAQAHLGPQGTHSSGRSVHLASMHSSNYYVDNYQQYLAKNPFGYRCHANTGVRFPA
jgi:peptide-methionine (S)-S-oxide reductase